MQRTISTELAATALNLSRAWSGSAPRLEEALTSGLQHFWSARGQHTSSEVAYDSDRSNPASADSNRQQGASAQASGTRSIHSSADPAQKEAPAPVIGTRDTCYHAAPACIDITAEIRAAAEAEMTWQAYVLLHRSQPC